MATAKAKPAAKPTPAKTQEVAPIEQPTPHVIESPGLIAVVSKAELDQEVTTAKLYPRSVQQFQADAEELATLNEQTASECIYAIPREGKIIRGPSARFAEILHYAYRNCRAGARVVEETDTQIIAQGMFRDLERTNTISYNVGRRITNKYGVRFSSDMIITTGNAACSIALRNVVLKAIPKALWSPIFERTLKTVAGDAKTIAARRTDMFAYLARQGVTEAQIYNVLGVRGGEDVGLDELATLHGLATAVKEGDLTIEQAFNPRPAPVRGVAGATEALARARGGEGEEDSNTHAED